MKLFKEKDMIKGWFVGDFPCAFTTKDCEVAIKRYKAGDFEDRHVHKIATELTFVVSGKVMLNGIEYNEGDIIVLEPGDSTDFKALTDAVDIVVKVPSVIGDKYFV